MDKEKYTIEYDEVGGYDCITPAWLIYGPTASSSVRSTGAVLTVDEKDFNSPEECMKFAHFILQRINQ